MPHVLRSARAGACQALSVALLLMLLGCGRQSAPPEPVRAVRTQVVTQESSGPVLEYAAELRARTESRLAFRVGGKLQERRVSLGDVVKPGQVLARLDAQDLMLAQEAARAAMNAARVNRDQAGADYKRFIDLHQQGFISAAELERRDAVFKAAQAQLDQAKAQATVQSNQSDYAQLRADAAGVITGVLAEPGMVIGAGAPVLQLAHDGPRDVVFSVPEQMVSRLREAAGRPGALSVRLWGGEQGAQAIQLREVSAAADPATRTFLVKADAGKLDARLGQTATVRLELPKQHNFIKLPLSAVLEQQGKTSVWVLDAKSMTVRLQAIRLQGAEGNEVLVAEGLSPGQEVVTAGVHVLTPGQKVSRYAAPAAAPAASR
ncbi:efflux RND transporter periplasmic adaptor subunit [Kinneretia asaccharophila]|uniref:RND family efflux transporter MFP subunit n=1 Tax=Roseateles asaccharophilus TaxID=582607 RepID=A0A4R6N978_9BURK|nr:efflux RND transporter periplasmic adaptor subunit [Roseateles asaccharophilus]MDN3543932.1 efflux RND transporter periplasmic adaptor subunit [Roseateles asaccharophilus]TDP11689.1 RND family efflux transporter MFP subunit [Roseateles asaccharophilus]